MNSERIKQIVSEAFDLEPAQRDTFVRRACDGDQPLLAEVLSLLDAASNASRAGFLPASAQGGDAVFLTAPDERPQGGVLPSHPLEAPEQFGRYKVLERIGEGGMGIVYRAEQRVPMRREVVVKVIKLGMDTKLVIARFEAERQALAMMDHPHIAKVYDAGTDDRGRPYFVMEYVKGTPILDYCDRNHLIVRQRLELFMQVCQAIQHAHHKGIIHRDIKPSNILVSTQDGKPFAKVIDFGIAKATNQRLTDRTLFTEHVNMIGTPAYMSPEQADGNIDIDTRTDVYSLGVVLYELLTGHTPFDSTRLKSAALNEIARIIREEDPPKPSTRVNTMNTRPPPRPSAQSPADDAADSGQTLATLAKARGSNAEAYGKSLQGEIDWIVMKAIEKDRARRYATPNELAEDVERHLNNLPILAAPPSLMYQAKKFARKYRVPVAAGMTITLVLLIAIICVSALAIELKHQVLLARTSLLDAQSARVQESVQRQEADRQRGTAESAARSAKYEAARNQANYLISQNLLDQALVSAKEAYHLGGNWQDGLLLSQIVNESRKTWHLEHSIPTTEPPLCAAISQTPRGSVMVVAYPSSLVEYDLETGQPIVQSRPLTGILHLTAFAGTTSQIAAITSDSVRILSLGDLTVIRQHDFRPLGIISAATAASTVAVTLSDYTTQAYSSNLALLGSQPWPREARLNQHQPLEKLAISPDGQWIVSSGVTWWNDCLFWNVSTNKTFVHTAPGQSIRFIDNTTLFSAAASVAQGTAVLRVTIDPVHLSAEQLWLCTLPVDNTGGFFANLAGDRNGYCLNATSGYAVVTFGSVSEAYPEIVTQRYASLLGRNDLSPKTITIASDGSRFVLDCAGRLMVFDQAHAWQSPLTKGLHAALGASAMYEVEQDGVSAYAHITPTNPQLPSVRQRLANLPLAVPIWKFIICGAAVSPDQRSLAVRYAEVTDRELRIGSVIQNHTVVIYPALDPLTGRPGNTPPIQIRLITQDNNAADAAREYNNERILQFSPDGKYLLVGTRLTVAELYRTSDGALIHYWPPGQLGPLVTSIGNSQYFADPSLSGNSIRLISWETGSVERELKMPGKVVALCGAAAGEQLLVSIDGLSLARFNLATGELLHKADSNLEPVDISPDGKVFIGFLPDGASADNHGSLLLADGETCATLAVLSHGVRRGTPAQFAADGQSFMLAGNSDSADLVRNLSPDAADQILQEPSAAPTNAMAETPASELPPIRLFPAAPTTAAVDTSVPLEATDMPKLTARIGTAAIVVGNVVATGQNPSHNSLFINFGERGKSFIVYVPPNVYPTLNSRFGGSALATLDKKRLRITGTIVAYHELPEIKLDDAANIDVLDTAPATAPAR